ncbi:MAG: YqeG family HAD IIIA-type phosphatase [Clostridia bacterium]|nr:YqeG family HAD IIIA-type phosphatase [Clostridia bacterium]
MVSPMPKYRYKSVLDISVEDLHKMGAKAVALDIDNTICNDGKQNCINGLEEWIENVQNAGVRVMILSNAMPRRPKNIAKRLGLSYLAMARKPKSHKLLKAAEMMNINISELAMVGDQLFADVMAANDCGAIAIRVEPLEGETRFKKFYERRQAKETPVLKEFEKLHGFGYYD